MSTISSVSSTGNPYQATNQAGMGQIIQDFNSIGSALQSGNVSDAQTALSSFQQDLQSNPQLSSSQPFGNNSQANTDYQNLVSSLQTSNLSSAQKAFASLQTDLQSAQNSAKTTHKGGHRHHGSGGASTASLINSLSTNSSTTSTTSASLTTATTNGTGTGTSGIIGPNLLNATA